jgi:antitoxin component of RelBE/YafQ-DinJ toxin-antitoxin module
MKTTLDLPESLLREAKAVAAKEGITLTELVESGLRKAVEQRSSPRAFRLPDASWGQGGLIAGYEWSRVRDLIYGADSE